MEIPVVDSLPGRYNYQEGPPSTVSFGWASNVARAPTEDSGFDFDPGPGPDRLVSTCLEIPGVEQAPEVSSV